MQSSDMLEHVFDWKLWKIQCCTSGTSLGKVRLWPVFITKENVAGIIFFSVLDIFFPNLIYGQII